MCHIQPLTRKSTKEANITTNEHLESKDQQLFINYETCPASAFTEGDSLSAQQYLEHQNVQHQEYHFLHQINTILKRYSELYQKLHPETVKSFYQTLVDLFYFTIEYQEEMEAFYQTLHDQFGQFLNNLNSIIESSGKKE